MPLKSNRKVALSVSDKWNGRHQSADMLKLESVKPVTVYLEVLESARLLVKQVFTNEDGLKSILYLVTGDTTLDGNGMTTIYQK